MSPTPHHECIRVPVTALAAVGPFLLSAEGPFIRFYCNQDSSHYRFLASRRIFQEHAIHGISARTDGSNHVTLAVWGGPLVRFLHLRHVLQKPEVQADIIDVIQLSPVLRSPDWILHLGFGPETAEDASEGSIAVCAAVTAHNALIRLTLQLPDMVAELCELTASSRSILYSAHLLWENDSHVLVAAGTAFGEIMFWSWSTARDGTSSSCIHKVFLGHEGSIFGVHISKETDVGSGRKRRFLASCSDDRTIRVWDVSDIAKTTEPAIIQSETERTRHTGFSNVELDAESSDSPCLAIGWGHLSRVWKVQFLDSQTPGPTISLLSAGEDATSRTWQFTLEDDEPSNAPLKLKQLGSAAYHSGKNLWSTALFGSRLDNLQVVAGGADSKISAHPLYFSSRNGKSSRNGPEYTVADIIRLSQQSTEISTASQLPVTKKRVAEFFRSYAFVDSSSFLLSTNSGKIFLATISFKPDCSGVNAISDSELIAQVDEVSGYSICAAESRLGIGFVAGSRGGVYMYRKGSSTLSKIYDAPGKVGSMFIARTSSGEDSPSVVLLVTLMGRQLAQMLYIDSWGNAEEPVVSRTADLALPESGTAATVTSMAYTSRNATDERIFLGFRAGSITAYSFTQDSVVATGFYDKVHGKEAVTSLLWYPTASDPSTGHLVSAGRDGCCAIHHVDLSTDTLTLVHHLPLPVGPNIEGLYDHHGHLMMYGFSSTKFVLYDMTVEEEIMNVEAGGSHRSWAFRPSSGIEGGGTLVWNRASTTQLRSQSGPNHKVIRSGGHGREIKTVAISRGIGGDRWRKLIATGAEDTDIKIFEYVDGDFVCRKTLRKHNTGIQQLQWSDDGEYLFSSGGCEEFYVWRVSTLPSFIGIGVLCESICAPESEHSDLRLTAFDTRKEGDGFVIAMVFSDSSMRVYKYAPTATQTWQTLATGTYFTSCLTQCVFLSPHTILTAGTDGHSVLWPLKPDPPATTETLTWTSPSRLHQNTSKTLSTHPLSASTTLLVSGGDDGSLALFTATTTPASDDDGVKDKHGDDVVRKSPPVVILRAHTSAITATSIMSIAGRIYVLTSGNDEWIRFWEVVSVTDSTVASDDSRAGLTMKRMGKLKTNVADVSSMAILSTSDEERGTMTKVVVCGVGMEVLCLGGEEE